MITYGTIYIIAQNFNETLEFYKKLFERDVDEQNKMRFERVSKVQQERGEIIRPS